MLAVVILAVVLHANCLESDSKQSETQQQDSKMAAMRRQRRATWLETRDVQTTTKLHVLQALQALISEGIVNPEVLRIKLGSDKRSVGLCAKKNKLGKTKAVACYTGDDEDLDKK